MENSFRWNLELLEKRQDGLKSRLTLDLPPKEYNIIESNIKLYSDLKILIEALENSAKPIKISPEDKLGAVKKYLDIINDDNHTKINKIITTISNENSIFPVKYLDYLLNVIPYVFNTGHIINSNQLMLNPLKISNNELFNISKDFYKWFSPEFFDSFSIVFKSKGSIHIQEAKYIKLLNARCFMDTYNQIPYIYIIKDNSILDIYFLIHELMHGISKSMNNHSFHKETLVTAILKETPCAFIELVLSDYLIDIGFHKEDVNTKDNIKIQDLKLKSLLLTTILFIIKLKQQNKTDFNSLMSMINNDNFFTTEQELKENILTIKGGKKQDSPYNSIKETKYIMAFLIALDLYEQYKKDKELGLKNLITVIKYKGEDPIPFLHSIGIDSNSYFELHNFNKYVKEQQSKVLKKDYQQ